MGHRSRTQSSKGGSTWPRRPAARRFRISGGLVSGQATYYWATQPGLAQPGKQEGEGSLAHTFATVVFGLWTECYRYEMVLNKSRFKCLAG